MKKLNRFFESYANKLTTEEEKQELNKLGLRVGQANFSRDIFDFEEMTPHTEMRKSIFMYEKDPNMQTGVDLMSLFIKPEEIKVKSEDKATQEYWNDWLTKRDDFDEEIDEWVKCALKAGNSYLNNIRDSKDKPSNYKNIDDPSRIAYNLHYGDNREANSFWLFQLPRVRGYSQTFMDKKAKQWSISYVRGGNYLKDTFYGIGLPKDKLSHFKLNRSTDGFYGRSLFASGLDALDVIREIVKDYAIIARHRAIPKKVFTIGDKENPASPDDIDMFNYQVDTLDDENHIVINKPLKQESLAYNGDISSMSFEIDYLRKSTTGSLSPNVYTNFASEVNRDTAEEAKVPFQIKVSKIKKRMIKFLNKVIIKEIMKYNTFLKDATFEFGDADLRTRTEIVNSALQLYDRNGATYNELRKANGFIPLPNGDTLFKKDIEPVELPEEGGGFFPQSQSMEGETLKEEVSEIDDDFKTIIADAQDELRNWKHEIDEKNSVVKFYKRNFGTMFTFYITKRLDGEYSVQLYEKQERLDRKVVSGNEVIKTLGEMYAMSINKVEGYKIIEESYKRGGKE